MSDDIRDLLAAWAIDAVDEDERAHIEARLHTDPDLRAEADGFLATAAGLADTEPAPPPPSLRESVLRAIAETPQISPAPGPVAAPAEPPTVPAPDPASAPDPTMGDVIDLGARRIRKRPLVFVAAAAVMIIALAVSVTTGQDELTRTERIAAVLRDDGAVTVPLDGDGIGSVEVVWSPTRGDGVIVGSGIRVPPEDRTYELWVIAPDSTGPVSVGIFAPTPEGELEALLVDFAPGDAVLAVSEEPAGGSPEETPTGEIVAVSA